MDYLVSLILSVFTGSSIKEEQSTSSAFFHS